jgi:hypothetical protein
MIKTEVSEKIRAKILAASTLSPRILKAKAVIYICPGV